ncbi:MAG: DegQ family serine endoprotease [Alphaproteobacteria bacterium]|nr:DegQ family serine endoprotease [Alphaproteobacteria bacterium]
MTWRRIGLALAGAACPALLLFPAFSGAQPAAESSAGAGRNLTQQTQKEVSITLPSFAPLAERVLPAVVNISVESTEDAGVQGKGDAQGGVPSAPGGTPFDQFMRRFFSNPFRNPQEKTMALGSGVVIDPAGYIATNGHVVANAQKVTVTFQDNSQHPAKVVGHDQKTDIALLKIDTKQPLAYVTWGNSDEPKVGDWVVAVGNPFGLGGTVTAGIVSALGRNINEGPYDDFLQIDAPINRGNSGGPTFNLQGQVIGINTAIYSPSGGSVGIGFAVPSNIAKHVVAQLKEHGHVTWGWLGVAIQNITPAIAESLGLDPEHPMGALIASVTRDSPAQKAGLQSGDVVIRAGGHDIKTVHDLPRLVAAAAVGSKMELTIRRGDKQQEVEATIGEMPEKVASAVPGQAQPNSASALGMELAPLAPELRSELHVPKDVNGVVVGRIANDSPALALGVQPGDVIVSIDRKPVKTPEEAATELKEAASHGNILMLLNRHGVSQFVGLSTDDKAMSGSSR